MKLPSIPLQGITHICVFRIDIDIYTILLKSRQSSAHLVRFRLGMSPLSHATLLFSTSGVWGWGCEYCGAVCVNNDDYDILKYGVLKK